MKKAKKFFEDYPIILLVTAIFSVGILAGYFLGRQKPLSLQKAEVNSVKPEVSKDIVIAAPVPAPLARPAPEPKPFPKPLVVEEMMAITEKLAQPAPVDEKPWKPKISFVIDDLGYNKRYDDILFSIDRPITIAILPQLPYSRHFAEKGKEHGLETILHLPLEPEHDENPGPGVLTLDMSLSEVRTILNKNLESVPGISGVNNHMGSRATQDRPFMYLILKELKRRKLFYLDSLTHPESVGYNVAFAVGIPSFERDVFLDNVDDYDYIMDQIEGAAKVAKQVGKAIAIGHYRENTLRAIRNSIPKLEREGFEISSLRGSKR